jgi:hypothetical protein
VTVRVADAGSGKLAPFVVDTVTTSTAESVTVNVLAVFSPAKVTVVGVATADPVTWGVMVPIRLPPMGVTLNAAVPPVPTVFEAGVRV